MLFWVFLVLLVFLIFLSLFCLFIEDGVCISGPSLSVSLILGCFVFGSWFAHAKDLSTIEEGHRAITLYQKKIDSLTTRLEDFDYPQGSLLNADNPIASIVQSLSQAEDGLLKAKLRVASSIEDIESRRLGPMSGVISFVGDYKEGGKQ